ncbi:MAG: hypothetical protein ACJ71T_01260 [Actinomycetales bacterium]
MTTVRRNNMILIVVSAIETVSLILAIAGIPTLILALVGLSKRHDETACRRWTRAGWLTMGGILAISAIATVIDYVFS